jgi:hypothetical protein
MTEPPTTLQKIDALVKKTQKNYVIPLYIVDVDMKGPTPISIITNDAETTFRLCQAPKGVEKLIGFTPSIVSKAIIFP